MTYHFADLDPVVRELMLDELASDIADGRLYESKRAVAGSGGRYIDLLREAFTAGDADTLTNQLASAGIFAAHQSDGKTINVADSAAALGDGQFNAYYARAVCRRAIEEGRAVEIYRGQPTIERRASSEALIGTNPDPVALLEELREHSLEPWKFSSVGKVNSGITIKLV
ncbi:hypothetical protein [Microbacterium hominis]|uniref:hypothetical protein n=1 Tax=Microbacterium hominis TaxID=162426 RepID=UPI00068FD3F1|nr:hypothetical protein [Microbacterium hominis]